MKERQVRVSDRSSADLQHGLRGTLLGGVPNERGELLVRLEPNACRLYGGDYWFPADELDELHGKWWSRIEQAAAAAAKEERGENQIYR